MDKCDHQQTDFWPELLLLFTWLGKASHFHGNVIWLPFYLLFRLRVMFHLFRSVKEVPFFCHKCSVSCHGHTVRQTNNKTKTLCYDWNYSLQLFLFSTPPFITGCLSAAFSAFHLHAKKVFWWSESMMSIWEPSKRPEPACFWAKQNALSWAAAHLLIELCFVFVLGLKVVELYAMLWCQTDVCWVMTADTLWAWHLLWHIMFARRI